MEKPADLSNWTERIGRPNASILRRRISTLLGRSEFGFPGTQPVTLLRRHLYNLKEEDYLVCEKTDGLRCLLFFSRTWDGSTDKFRDARFFITRKNEFFAVRGKCLEAPQIRRTAGGHTSQLKVWHEGTVIDGELVVKTGNDQTQSLSFVMFDCLAVGGHALVHHSYPVRRQTLEQDIFGPWQAEAQQHLAVGNAATIQLELKKMIPSHKVEYILKQEIPRLQHGNDGLIFTRKNDPYVYGTNRRMFKWKPHQLTTVDFRLHVSPVPRSSRPFELGTLDSYWTNEIHLLAHHGSNEYRKYALLDVSPNNPADVQLLNMRLDSRILECFQHHKSGLWRPLQKDNGDFCFRDDKRHANHITVVEEIVENMKDPVTEFELISAATEVRAAWEKRARSLH